VNQSIPPSRFAEDPEKSQKNAKGKRPLMGDDEGYVI
jgi:hypothetical protein